MLLSEPLASLLTFFWTSFRGYTGISLSVSCRVSVCPSVPKTLVSVKGLVGNQVAFSDSSSFEVILCVILYIQKCNVVIIR